jgi:hypothetical protein
MMKVVMLLALENAPMTANVMVIGDVSQEAVQVKKFFLLAGS